MKYLFFDIECCNGRDICEFGYIVCDEKFNVLEQDDITINPNNRFRLTGRPDHRDITLFFPEKTYYKSPRFPEYYERIKSLIEAPDRIIVGHAISNDAAFLRHACQRYELPPINFRFNDSQKMFTEYFNDNKRISLEHAGELLAVEKPAYLHKSDEDSLLTMRFVQKMCENLGVTLPELIDMCPSCSGEINNFVIKYDDAEKRAEKWYEEVKASDFNLLRKKNYKLFKRFLQNVEPLKEAEGEFGGKTVCISGNYEFFHFREMLSLITLISERGGKYTTMVSGCDYFVTYSARNSDGNEMFCTRSKSVENACAEGKSIKVITFEELLQMLNITERELSEIPFPELKYFIQTNTGKPKHKKPQNKKPQ